MADWSKPTITSNYITFVDEVKNRDIDAITLGKATIINPPTGAIWLQRAPVVITEYDGATYLPLVLSVQGGGTGAGAAAGARTNLGLGTMSVQNASAIAVTGGTVANLSSSGSLVHTGSAATFIANVAGNAVIIQGIATSSYSLLVVGANVSTASWGVHIQAGYTRQDYCLAITNRTATLNGFLVYGDQVVHCIHRLIIPVGVDFWADQ